LSQYLAVARWTMFEEAAGELIVAGGDRAVDLEVTDHALDAVALLVERAVVLDLHPAV
jgi:hypothetical protein